MLILIAHMSKMVQIRNMPDDVHRRLKSKAAAEGTSLSEFLLREVTRVANSLSLEEVFERAKLRGPVTPGPSPEEMIRELRDNL
jgi:plasmid stability protein